MLSINHLKRSLYWKLKFFKKGFEFHEDLLIYKLLNRSKQNGIMIDVGAHFGESSEPYLLKGWNVYAFEPDPSDIKRHSLGKLEQRYSRFKLYHKIVSSRDNETVSFYSSEESTGISSVIPFTDSHTEVARVETITLKTFIKQQSIDQVDFLKIDTEGNDLFVLKGFPWESIRPDIILCEFEDKKTQNVGYTFKDIGDYLLSFDYHVFLSEWYPVVQYGAHHKWKSINKYPTALDNPNGWGNFIACSNNFAKEFQSMISK